MITNLRCSTGATMVDTVTVFERRGIVVTALPGPAPTVSVFDARRVELALLSPDEARYLGLEVSGKGFAEGRETGDAGPAVIALCHLGSALMYAAELLDPTTVGTERLAENLADLAEADQ